MGETVAPDSSCDVPVSLAFYFDHNMQAALVQGLKQRGIDVLTALEDGTDRFEDRALLERATCLNRIFVTQDQDLLVITSEFQATQHSFSGLIYCRTSGVSTSKLLDHLEMAARIMTIDDMASNILHIPL